jgi:hypothetical protein
MKRFKGLTPLIWALVAVTVITTIGLLIVSLKGSVEDVRLALLGAASFVENCLVLWLGYRLALVNRPSLPKIPTKDQVRTQLATFFEEDTGDVVVLEVPSQWGDDPLKDSGDVTDAQIASERTGDGE